jgi:hypothetical protein
MTTTLERRLDRAPRHPPPVPQGAPAHFARHRFTKEFDVDAPREAVWAWVNDPRTFTDTQVWPWRVEFVDGGMETGVLNVHHGPLMSLAGVVGEMDRPRYRDLQYLYGSYALSLRWFRPIRLEFFLEEEAAERTRVRVRLTTLVHRRMRGLWALMMRAYWGLFPLFARRGVRSHVTSAGPPSRG